VPPDSLANWEQGPHEPEFRSTQPSTTSWLLPASVGRTSPTLGDRLRIWRTAQGLSQIAVAKLLGVAPMTVGRIERGQTVWLTRRVRDALHDALTENLHGSGLTRCRNAP